MLAGYSEKKKPLGGYAVLAGLFTLALGSAVASAETADEELPELSWSDLLLLGVATHKLSRIVTKDLVTSPFRAPFVKFKKSAGAGEVEEEARGEGIQEAVGAQPQRSGRGRSRAADVLHVGDERSENPSDASALTTPIRDSVPP